MMQTQGTLWFSYDDKKLLTADTVELLKKIDEFGSISRAAKAVNISYKTAWEIIDKMQRMTGESLVIRVAGGKKGGGTLITDYSRHLLAVYSQTEVCFRACLTELSAKVEQQSRLYQQLWRLKMLTSARNQFVGKVAEIKVGVVNAEVVINLLSGLKIVSTVTLSSIESLGLKVDSEVYAFIKVSHVILSRADSGFKFSARNSLTGKVLSVNAGAVNDIVVLQLAGGDVLRAVVTRDAISDLQIAEGLEMCGVFKAGSVILGVKA